MPLEFDLFIRIKLLLKRILNKILRFYPITLLLLINIVVFFPHYLAGATFPWDFLTGYHPQTYFWYADGSFFSPPTWSPYTNFGYPSYLALQNSSFYPPIAFLDWLGFSYSIPLATQLQAFHVFIGALGIYFLLRSSAFSKSVAFFGAAAYHFSIGFFFNAQHPDIVRGYVWLPWLMWALTAPSLSFPFLRSIVLSFVLILLIGGSYPGVIVSAFYGVLFYLILWAIESRKVSHSGKHSIQRLKRYIIYTSIGVLIALLILSPKFLPVVVSIHEILNRAAVGFPREKLDWSHLPSLLFNFVNFSSTSSLYIVSFVPLLCFLGSFNRRFFRLGIGFAFFGLLSASQFFYPLAGILPGYSISRFPFSDYRAIIHIGLIIASVDVLEEILSGRPLLKRFVTLRIGLLFASVFSCFLFLAYFSKVPTASEEILQNGFSILNLATQALACICIFLLALIATCLKKPSFRRFLILSVITFSFLLAGFSIYSTRVTWLLPNFRANLRDYYGLPYKKLFGHARQATWPERPERKGNLKLTDDSTQIGPQGKSFYIQSFLSLANDNGVTLIRVLELAKTLGEPGNYDMGEFLSLPSRILVLPVPASEKTQKFDHAQKLSSCQFKELCGDLSLGSVQIDKFGISSSEFTVNLAYTALMVENETYFPGWKSQICNNQNFSCREGLEAKAYRNFLRSWELPPGQYKFRTYYETPWLKQAWLLFWLGVMLLLFLIVLTTRRWIVQRAKLSEHPVSKLTPL
jgi:hypothetical protein